MIIPLRDALLRRFSNLPAGSGPVPLACARGSVSPPGRIGPMRLLPLESAASIPAYLVLLRVGFTLRLDLRRARCALTAPFHPYLPNACASGLAVRSLLHWPSRGLEPSVPDVIRHTALRSSDFPPPRDTLAGAHGSDHPAACLSIVPQWGWGSLASPARVHL